MTVPGGDPRYRPPQWSAYPPGPSGYRPPRRQSSGAAPALLIVIVVLVAICGLGLVGVVLAAYDGDTNRDKQDSGAPAIAIDNSGPPDERPAGINATVRDGKFEFVVTDVQTGLKTLGDSEFTPDTAQGSYTVVAMSVKNIADRPQTFFSSNQYMFDQQGRRFENDSSAEIGLDVESALAVAINPGNSIRAKVVFDMPADAIPDHLVLHDSLFSSGARVDVK